MISRYTGNNLVKDVNRKLHNSGVSMASDFFGSVDEGRRNLIGKIKPAELKRSQYIENALYDQVDRYAAPFDMQYENVIDMKMLKSRKNLDSLEHPLEMVYEKRFDQKRRNARNVFTINYENGIKYMKIHHPRGLKECQHLVLQACESLTANGNWNVGGNIGNLTLDKLNHITGHGALRFDIDTSSTEGFLEMFNATSVDITDYMQIGALFTWLEFTLLNAVTSVKLSFGSSKDDYYSYTVNQPHDGNQFLPAWNLCRFPLELGGLEQIGFPNVREITYLRVDITTTGTDPVYGCHMDNIVARKGVVYLVKYDSAFMFADRTTELWKQNLERLDDYIIAEEDTYQGLVLEVTKVLMQETYDNTNKSQDDINNIKAELKEFYFEYKRRHKQDAIEAFDSLYIFGDQYSGLQDQPQNDWHQENGGGGDYSTGV